jgi:hypothetical protein
MGTGCGAILGLLLTSYSSHQKPKQQICDTKIWKDRRNFVVVLEINLNHLKTSLRMDILRTKTPYMGFFRS